MAQPTKRILFTAKPALKVKRQKFAASDSTQSQQTIVDTCNACVTCCQAIINAYSSMPDMADCVTCCKDCVAACQKLSGNLTDADAARACVACYRDCIGTCQIHQTDLCQQCITACQACIAACGTTAAAQTTLTGYAIIWNQLSDDRGGYVVRFAPNSAHFADPTIAVFHHDARLILGNTQNKSLRLTSDTTGVKVEIDLPATTQAADVATLVDSKYVNGMSFSMLYDDVLETAKKHENGQDIMEVSAFTCDEVTVTAIPSFTATSIQVQNGAKTTDDPAELARTRQAAPERVQQAIKLERLHLESIKL